MRMYIRARRGKYEITDHCIGCGTCVKGCPQRCIESGEQYRIVQENCLHCGSRFEHCPVKAVAEKRELF